MPIVRHKGKTYKFPYTSRGKRQARQLRIKLKRTTRKKRRRY